MPGGFQASGVAAPRTRTRTGVPSVRASAPATRASSSSPSGADLEQGVVSVVAALLDPARDGPEHLRLGFRQRLHLELLRAHQHGAGAVARIGRSTQRQRPERGLGGVAEEARVQHVDRAEEAGEPLVDRSLVEGRRQPLLDDRAVAQHGDAVGERERLLLVVCDEHRRHALLAQQGVDLLADVRAQRGVQRGERLVEQQRLRAGGRAHGRARRAAARRPRAGAAAGWRAGRCPTISSSSCDDGAAAFGAREAEADVAGHVEVWEQRAFLRDVADAATLGRHVGAAVVERLLAEATRVHARRARSPRSHAGASSCRRPRGRAPRSATPPARRARRRAAPAGGRSPSTGRAISRLLMPNPAGPCASGG